MRVDLRRADVAVAQEFLDDAQVRPAADQVSGEAMPQRVRRDVLQQPARPPVLFHQHPEPDPLHRLAGAREEQQLARLALQLRPALEQVALDRLLRRPAQRHDPLLHPLAQHAHAADLQIQVAQLQLAQLDARRPLA